MAIHTYLDRLNRWAVLSTNLKNRLGELPHLAAKQSEFEALVAEGLRLVAQQKQRTGEASELVDRRKALMLRGGHLRELLVAALRENFGPSSPRLVEFEIRPRGRRQPAPDSEPPGDQLQNPVSGKSGEA